MDQLCMAKTASWKHAKEGSFVPLSGTVAMLLPAPIFLT